MRTAWNKGLTKEGDKRLAVNRIGAQCYKDRYKHFEDLSQVDKGYIAGLIDGEGCLARRGYRWRYWTTYYYNLQITSSNRAVVDWLKDKLKAGCIMTRKPQKVHYSYVYVFNLPQAGTRYLLKEVLPSLIIKRKVAEQIVAELER